MYLVALVTVIALVEYLVFSFQVGIGRMKYGIDAPAISGHELFERYFRVQQNTLEQLIIFLPALWMAGYFATPLLAASIGCLFLVGRVVYFRGYTADPSKRSLGFLMGFVANALLLLITLFQVVSGFF